jgi:hypothetical protein
MSAPGSDPYEQLVALGISALELARAARLEELTACQQARAALMATLPAQPPSQAREALQRALVVEQALAAELGARRQDVIAALAEVRRGQRVATGYTPMRERLRVVNANA